MNLAHNTAPSRCLGIFGLSTACEVVNKRCVWKSNASKTFPNTDKVKGNLSAAGQKSTGLQITILPHNQSAKPYELSIQL